MFNANFSEKNKDEIKLQEIHGDALDALIDFCYTGRIEIDEWNALHLLQAASRMEFVAIETKCGDFLRKMVSVSNCLSIWTEMELLIQFEDLVNLAWTFIGDKFVDIVKCSKEFLELNTDYLLALLKRDDLKVCAEEQVFEALVKWVKHDPESRKCYVSELLQAIRFTQIKQEVSKRLML